MHEAKEKEYGLDRKDCVENAIGHAALLFVGCFKFSKGATSVHVVSLRDWIT